MIPPNEPNEPPQLMSRYRKATTNPDQGDKHPLQPRPCLTTSQALSTLPRLRFPGSLPGQTHQFTGSPAHRVSDIIDTVYLHPTPFTTMFWLSSTQTYWSHPSSPFFPLCFFHSHESIFVILDIPETSPCSFLFTHIPTFLAEVIKVIQNSRH